MATSLKIISGASPIRGVGTVWKDFRCCVGQATNSNPAR